MIAHAYAIAFVAVQKVGVDRNLTDNLAIQEAEKIFFWLVSSCEK